MSGEVDPVLILDKQEGETPLECIIRFKKSHPEYQNVKMTYAGRLDPIASGVLVILTGDFVHKKELFTKLPKVYECVALLGVETDTYDVLGMPSASKLPLTPSWQEGETAPEKLRTFIGTFSQEYPPYSSKTINGKQMHTLAREHGFEGLEIPKQTVTVKTISNIRMASVATEDLVQGIIETIKKVKGDFRQEESIKAWETISTPPAASGERPPLKEGERVPLVLFTIEVSGGTYIRSIVHELGRQLGCGACIIRLKRTSVGEYRLLDK